MNIVKYLFLFCFSIVSNSLVAQFTFVEEDTLIVNLPEETGSFYFTIKNESDSLSCLKWQFEMTEDQQELITLGIISINFDFVPGLFDSCPIESLDFECVEAGAEAQLGFYINSAETFLESNNSTLLTHFILLDNPNCDSILLRKPILFKKILSNIQETPSAEISLSPNPVSEYLNIESEEGNLLFQILTIRGQIVKTGSLIENKINTSELGDGLYIIILEDSNGLVSTQRFIKQRK